MRITESYGTVWLCESCFMHLANGECGDCHRPEGHDRTPLGVLSTPGTRLDLVPGMRSSEHAEDCLRRLLGPEAPDDYECDCETITYSVSQCEGCGSYLHGARYAATLFGAH